MTSNTPITLTLPHDFVGQLIEGLDALIEQWQYTARYEETGLVEDEFMARDCDNPIEAQRIADYYTRIKQNIEAQLPST